MTASHALVALASALLAGCWGSAGHLSFTGEPGGDDEHWSPNPDSGPDEDTGDADPSGVRPEVSHVDAWCYANDDGHEWWGMSAVGDDPQGVTTLAPFVVEGVEVADAAGDPVATSDLACEDSGQCWGSAQAGQIDVPCRAAEEHVFTFHVVDEDGNSSPREAVRGRTAGGPGG